MNYHPGGGLGWAQACLAAAGDSCKKFNKNLGGAGDLDPMQVVLSLWDRTCREEIRQ